jgi:hypothetical protein
MNPDAGNYFQQLMNVIGSPRSAAAVKQAGERLGAMPRAGTIAASPALAYGVGSLSQGDIAQGVGEIGGGVVGERLSRPLAQAAQTAVAGMGVPGKIAAPFVGMGVRALGGLAGGAVGGGIAQPAAAAAAGIGQNVVGAVTGQRREEGKSGVTGGGVGLENLTGEQKQIAEMLRLAGVNIPVEQARQLMPLANEMKNADMQRQMQLNQQLGQLTGALNRQQYAFQLAGGAQSEAGANLRTMMTSNPYAASTFRY